MTFSRVAFETEYSIISLLICLQEVAVVTKSNSTSEDSTNLQTAPQRSLTNHQNLQRNWSLKEDVIRVS